MTSNFKFIDLFCGIGGFHYALSSLGGECVFASDIDKECRKVYETNFGILPHGDITLIDEKDIPPHNVLCGGFPCQSFSKAGNRKGIEDSRGTLFYDIIRIASYHKPEFLLLENVRNLMGHDNGNTWRIIRKSLQEIGYNCPDFPIIFSPHFLGIPQARERVFILCKRKDLGAVKPFAFKKSHLPKCSIDSILQKTDEIDNISRYRLSEDEISLIELWNEFSQNINGDLPGFPVWADRMKELDFDEDLEILPSWKKTFIIKNNALYLNNKHFLDDWLAKAYKHPLFFGSKAMFEWQAGKDAERDIWQTIMHFRPSGIRVKAATYFPALVAITQTSIVGKLKRRITPRECARIQSFPEKFIIHPVDSVAYRQFGNSVNVEVVRMFATYLLGYTEEFAKYNVPIQYLSGEQLSIELI